MTEAPSSDLLRCRARLPPGPWATLREALCAHYHKLPPALWDERFAQGHVVDADGHALAPETPFRAGAPLYYLRAFHETPIPVAETILHADDHLVVVDKPHFLPVIPAGKYRRETLAARMIARLGNPELAPVHRIDRGTAGLVLFSARRATRGAYQALFRERRIEKTYEALAPPLPDLAFPHVRESRLAPHADGFRSMEVPGEPNSRTRIEVLERGAPHWRYALFPHTGRMHQLRVHLAALGAPIANDAWYPDALPAGPDDFDRPLKLLAKGLAFVDPVDGTERRYETRLSLPL